MKTSDGIEITKGMKVWICPFFDEDTPMDYFSNNCKEEHTVIDTLNGCMVYTRKHDNATDRRTYPSYHRHAVYADENKAIENRVILLRGIKSQKTDALNEEIKKVNEEMDAIVDTIRYLKNDIDETEKRNKVNGLSTKPD